jgi:hypothetical protein
LGDGEGGKAEEGGDKSEHREEDADNCAKVLISSRDVSIVMYMYEMCNIVGDRSRLSASGCEQSPRVECDRPSILLALPYKDCELSAAIQITEDRSLTL